MLTNWRHHHSTTCVSIFLCSISINIESVHTHSYSPSSSSFFIFFRIHETVINVRLDIRVVPCVCVCVWPHWRHANITNRRNFSSIVSHYIKKRFESYIIPTIWMYTHTHTQTPEYIILWDLAEHNLTRTIIVECIARCVRYQIIKAMQNNNSNITDFFPVQSQYFEWSLWCMG